MDLPVNIIDLTAGLMAADGSDVDSYWPELGIIMQGKSYQTLLGLPVSNVYGTSGDYLQNLFRAQAELFAAERASKEFLNRIISTVQAGNQINKAPAVTARTFEQLAEFINAHAGDKTVSSIGILKYIIRGLRVRSLLRQVFARIAFVVKAIARAVPRFCAVNWARRQFYLMHGIRPPRGGEWEIHYSTFECAR
jgi:hypothetical protein